MKKIPKITLWVLFLISIVITVLYVANMGGDNLDGWTLSYLNWAYITLGLTILAIILMPLLTWKQRSIKLRTILIALGITVVLVGGSYLLAPGSPVTLANGTHFEGSVVKLTDTGLYMTYILVGCAIVAIVGGSIYKAVRKN